MRSDEVMQLPPGSLGTFALGKASWHVLVRSLATLRPPYWGGVLVSGLQLGSAFQPSPVRH